MSGPLFSVIIPTFHRAQFVGEAVASVLGQTVDDLECLVVDDGSAEPVQLPQDDGRLQVVRRDVNGGPAAARNSGVAKARGRYIAFLDDDDVFTPDRLELAVEGLRRAPVATCWTAFLDQPSIAGGRRLEGDVGDTILDGLTPSLGAVAVRREALLSFDDTLDNLEDIDWWLRTAQLHHVTTVAQVGYLVRRHDTPRARTGTESRIRDNLAYFDRRANYFAAHPRAAAFRWKRVGLLALRAGDPSLARRALVTSLRRRPSFRTAWHLVRSTVGGGSHPRTISR